MKTCPYCAEEIQDAAIVCKHCSRDLAPVASAPIVETRQRTASEIRAQMVGAALIVAAFFGYALNVGRPLMTVLMWLGWTLALSGHAAWRIGVGFLLAVVTLLVAGMAF